jgi:phage shock protein E
MFAFTLRLSLVAASLLLSSVALAEDRLPHTQDSVAKAKQNVDSGKAVIVDVREHSEWDAGHVKGAVHLPMSQLVDESKLADLLKKLDKSKIIYTHCKAGGRASSCGHLLKQQGYDVRPLKPGYEQLIEGGFEKAK